MPCCCGSYININFNFLRDSLFRRLIRRSHSKPSKYFEWQCFNVLGIGESTLKSTEMPGEQQYSSRDAHPMERICCFHRTTIYADSVLWMYLLFNVPWMIEEEKNMNACEKWWHTQCWIYWSNKLLFMKKKRNINFSDRQHVNFIN